MLIGSRRCLQVWLHISCIDCGGEYLGDGTTCDGEPCAPQCEGDYNGDGETNVSDLLTVIGGWGNPYDVSDLLLVISDWNCGAP